MADGRVLLGSSVGVVYEVSEVGVADAVVPGSGSRPVGGYLVYGSVPTILVGPVSGVLPVMDAAAVPLGLELNVSDALETDSLVTPLVAVPETLDSDADVKLEPVSGELSEFV